MRSSLLLVSAVLVPFLSIVGQEVWLLTANLRYPVAVADPVATMRAVVYATHGKTRDVLKMDTAYAQPHQPVAPGFIIINVTAASINPVDFKLMRAEQPSLLVPKPHIVGFDLSGVVVAAGEGSGFAVGDAVYGMLPLLGSPWGSLAELAVAHASAFAKAPASIPLADAAALPLVALTVMQVFDQAGLKDKEAANTNKSVLVHAAAGGVGSFAVQYARHVLGFGSVFGTCSSSNAERVQALGATTTIDYNTVAFDKVVSDAGGVDVVLDPMAWSYMQRTLNPANRVLRPAAKYCHIHSTDWAESEAETSLLTLLSGPGSKWRSRLVGLFEPNEPQVFTAPVRPDGSGLARLARLVDSGLVKPVIDRFFDGLESATEALEYLQSGHARGKLVIRVAGVAQ